MKNSIKREQRQTDLFFAEREKFRPQVKQKKLWVMAAIVTPCGANVFTACKKAHAQEDNPMR